MFDFICGLIFKKIPFSDPGLTIQPISIIGDKKVPAVTEDMNTSPGSPLTPSEEIEGKKNNKFMWTLKVE